MSRPEPPIRLGAGPLDLPTLAAAVGRELGRQHTPGGARLEGPKALAVSPVAGGLRVDRLVARTGSGRRVTFEDVVVEALGDGPVPVVIDWEYRPLDRQAVVETLEPVLRLARGPDDAGDGRFDLREPRPPADRLDGCDGWVQWRGDVDDRLKQIDGTLLELADRTEPEDGLFWSVLLAPVVAAVAGAVTPDTPPADACRTVGRVWEAVAGLVERSAAVGGARAAIVATTCGTLTASGDELSDLTEAGRRLRSLTAAVGLRGTQFPDVLYRSQRVMRKAKRLAAEPVATADGPEFMVTTRGIDPDGWVLVRWPLTADESLGLGDIRVRAGLTGAELRHQPAASADNPFHVLDGPFGDRLSVTALVEVGCPECWFYEPVRR